MICPLCRSQGRYFESISAQSLSSLWLKLGVDTSEIITCREISKIKCDNCGLGYFDPPCPGNDRFYGSLANWDWYYKHAGKTEYEFTAKILCPGDNLVDVGCGIGEFCSYLPEDVLFTGIELSSRSVELARGLGRNVHQIDITAAPSEFKNNFDIVTCFQVLEHVVDVHSFFKALVNLCKPNGTIVIAVPNNDGFIGDAVNNALNMPPHHVLLWNKQSLNYLAHIFNLEVLTYLEEDLSPIHRYWAYTTAVINFFHSFTKIDKKTINTSIFYKLLYKISATIARPLSFISASFSAKGHSAIIVLRKTKDD